MRVTILQTTVGDTETAETIAAELIDMRVAACVQATPIVSRYRWEDEVVTEEEVRLDIKTAPGRVEAAMSALGRLHPYDEPEIIVIEAQASRGYGDWVAGETARH